MAPRTPTVVLVHGLAILRRADAMFQGLAAALEQRGHKVARTIVQGDGTLEELSERLWKQLATIDGPLALLCHSMGGLQARAFLLDDARASRLNSIVTIGSPHRGVPLVTLLAPFQRAYRDLTPMNRDLWDRAHGEAERLSASRHGVRCLSVVARLDGLARHAQLVGSQALLQALEGPNDGLVAASSQRWGTTGLEVELDHLECAAIGAPYGRRDRVIEAWARMAELATTTTQPPPTRG